jgi:hypothetical protein
VTWNVFALGLICVHGVLGWQGIEGLEIIESVTIMWYHLFYIAGMKEA